MAQAIPQVFNGRYEITRHIARGGMAEVFLALDLTLDRPVALKVLFPELSTDSSFVERFRREAQAAANLTHPNIVSIFDWGEGDGTYFIVMEYIEGRTLGDIIRVDGRIGADRAADIAADTAGALAFAHRSGVVHRDVKPGNVLMSPAGQVKVADFGIARAANTDNELTQAGAVMGTATYFSPEQAQGHRVDGRSDVYSLGIVLYEMLVGKPPFAGDNPMAIAYKHVRETPVAPRTLKPDIPAALEAIVLQAIAKDPADRYAGADELRQDLQRFRQNRPVLADPTVAVAAVDATQMVGATQLVDATQVAPAVASRSAIATADVPTGEPPRRSNRTFVILLVVMLLVLAGLLWLFAREAGILGQSGSSLVTTPQVVNFEEEEAKDKLADAGLKATVVPQPLDDAAKLGKVQSQDPVVGTQIDRGASVTIRVGAPPELVQIPDVRTRPRDQARTELATAGFTNITDKEQPDDSVAAGLVTAVDPPVGRPVAKSTPIVLTVSSGKAQKAVPPVVGKDYGAALSELVRAGFEVKQVKEASPDKPVDQVLRTDPAAGTLLPANATITVYTSSGPAGIEVPNLVGLTETRARAELESRGLKYAEGAPMAGTPGMVASQTPAAFARVDRGEIVTVRLGQAATTTTAAPATTSTTTPRSTTTSRPTTTTAGG